MVPGIMMLLLILIPAMMTAVGVVREKEMGSITNLYVTPVTGLEFLLGKQLPYVGHRPRQFRLHAGVLRCSCSRCRSRAASLALRRGRGALRRRHDRLRPPDLGLRAQPGGRDLRRRHPDHAPRRAVLGNVHPAVLAHRQREDDGAGLSQHLLPADQPGQLHQGAGLRRAGAESSGAGRDHPRPIRCWRAACSHTQET